jgi:IS5 family transposase
MKQTVPWLPLISLIEPDYPSKGRRGRQPMPMARKCCAFTACRTGSVSYYRQMEDALYENESIRRLAGFGSVTNALPDSTTILNFCHWLEKKQPTQKLLKTLNAYQKNPVY